MNQNYQQPSKGDYMDYQDKLNQLLYNQQIGEGSVVKNPKTGNEYELIQQIGSGEFGVVYEAQYFGIDKNDKFAIKIAIKAESGDDDGAYQCFQKEEQIQQQVKNENIVNIFESFETANNTFIVMEKCDNDLLEEIQFSKVNKESKRYSAHQAIDYLAQILNAFQGIQRFFKSKYNQEVAHRDLKPSNIMLKDGILKITDFGTAKVIKKECQFFKSYVGTALWMAPEIMKSTGDNYSNKCDIFSIGIIFYQLIYGKVPFNGNSQIAILDKIEKQNIYYDIYDTRLQQVNKLLQKMFIPDYKQRIEWETLYKHPYFVDRQNRKLMIQQYQNNDKYFRDFPQEVKDDLQNYYLSTTEFLQQIDKNKSDSQLNSSCQKVIKQLTKKYIFHEEKLLGLFLIHKYNSLNLSDTKKLLHNCIGKSIDSMDKLANQYPKRKQKEFMNDINDTFYDSEMVYCLEKNQQGKQQEYYLIEYYKMMTEQCCQYQLFEKKDMKEFSESLLTFEEVQEKYKQKEERKEKEKKKREQEKEKLKQRANQPLYFNPYADRNLYYQEEQKQYEQKLEESKRKSSNILVEQSRIMMEKENKQDLGFEIIIDVHNSQSTKSKEDDYQFRLAKSFSGLDENSIIQNNQQFEEEENNNNIGRYTSQSYQPGNYFSDPQFSDQFQNQRSKTVSDQLFEQFQQQKQQNQQQNNQDEQETKWENSIQQQEKQKNYIQEIDAINLGSDSEINNNQQNNSKENYDEDDEQYKTLNYKDSVINSKSSQESDKFSSENQNSY